MDVFVHPTDSTRSATDTPEEIIPLDHRGNYMQWCDQPTRPSGNERGCAGDRRRRGNAA
jgi:hypothetical protein